MRPYRLKQLIACSIAVMIAAPSLAQDWDAYPVPAAAPAGMHWSVDWDLSDEFNYDSATPAGEAEFFSKWRDSKPDGWRGPGATYFNQDNYFVDDGSLTIFGSSIPEHLRTTNPTDPSFQHSVYTSYITSDKTLGPGVYTEVMMKGGGTRLSTNFWLLDDNNETEIDVVEVYGDGSWFPRHPATNVHFFTRSGGGGITGNANNQDHHPSGNINYAATWHRYGVHWLSETEVDLYYDGQLVRNLDLPSEIVDPKGEYLDEPLRLILDLESHAWRGEGGIPTEANLANGNINNMQVQWIRTYEMIDLPGDYNADGVVDAADYGVWRDSQGDAAGTLPNDTDGSVIGPDQYATWLAGFGSGAGANSATIPEPTAALLLLTVLSRVGGMRR